MQCGENLSKLLYFFNISNPLEVVWSHATNSKAKLERALAPGRYVYVEGNYGVAMFVVCKPRAAAWRAAHITCVMSWTTRASCSCLCQ